MNKLKSPASDFGRSTTQGLDKTSKGIIPEDETERIRNQTHEEWWADYDSATAIKPTPRRELNKHTEAQKVTGGLSKQQPIVKTTTKGCQNNKSTIVKTTIRGCRESEAKKEKFIFDSFRTTRLGRLVISFVSLNSGSVADCFFNVDIKKQRDSGEHRTGNGGQFFPKRRSKFRKFWMSVVKKEPRRWARVHKEINSRFKDRLFTGQLVHKQRGSGEPYLELQNVTELGTEKAQEGHNEGTEKAQDYGTGN